MVLKGFSTEEVQITNKYMEKISNMFSHQGSTTQNYNEILSYFFLC